MSEPIPKPLPPPQPAAQQWYLPSWGERLRLMGWRVLYFVPMLLIVILAAVVPMAYMCGWKLLVVLVALPIAAALNSAKRAIRLRKQPFCIHCGYDLTGLPDGHVCPECGVQFWHRDIADYRRDPYWYIQRHRYSEMPPEAGVDLDAWPPRVPREDATS